MPHSPIAQAPTNTTEGSRHAVTGKTRYTKSLDTSGWLRIRLEPSGESAFVCEFVKVLITREGDRTHFLIQEGRYQGKTASLGTENANKCLVSARRGSGAMLTAKIIGRSLARSEPRGGQVLSQLFATLSFDGKSAKITLDSDVNYVETNRASPEFGKRKHSTPLPKGTYKILVPYTSGDAANTAFYVSAPGGDKDLKYHTVWFPIEYAATHNSNFVHVGNLSEGCVTMYQLNMWNSLYQYLISNRMGKNNEYVGTITIA